ncbi:hypothetical protein QE152_g33585 [Popillia japonica]|uniref:Secreted protein n=1 Tax=Popillia japonica TaxID=7064 RepID=A0AAW1IWA3_POPJA
MRSTLSFLSGAVAGSLKVRGIRACIAWMSAGAPVLRDTDSWSSATSLPYRGTCLCRDDVSPPPPAPGTGTRKRKSLVGFSVCL